LAWVGLPSEPKAKLQSFLSAGLQEQLLAELRASLGEDDQVDLRTAGGPGAGGFCKLPVLFEGEQPKTMQDQHFVVSLKDRLRLRVCSPGAICQHRRRNGTLCGQPLDPRGKHALKCDVGPTREARHDGLRDFTAEFYPKVSGYVACKEQRVVAWDRRSTPSVPKMVEGLVFPSPSYGGSIHFLVLPSFGCQAFSSIPWMGTVQATPCSFGSLATCISATSGSLRLSWPCPYPLPDFCCPVRASGLMYLFCHWYLFAGGAFFAGRTNYWCNGGLWFCTRPYLLFDLGGASASHTYYRILLLLLDSFISSALWANSLSFVIA
jgi:hypothetical protein